MATYLTLLLFILIFLPIGFGVEQCYIYLTEASYPFMVENCVDRYGSNTTTKCVYAIKNNSNLLRMQCMSDEQAEKFCQKWSNFEEVRCDICNENLCNNRTTNLCSSNVLLLFFCILIMTAISRS